MQEDFAKILSFYQPMKETIPREDGSLWCRMACEEGDAQMELYQVLPGVVLLSYQMDTHACSCFAPVDSPVVELLYCQEGRVECRMQDGCSLYMGEGELFLSRMGNHSQRMDFPLGRFRGVSILVDPEELMGNLPLPLREAKVSVPEVFQRLFSQDDCCLIHNRQEVERIFVGLLDVPPPARTAYFQLKAQELLLFLAFWDGMGGQRHRTFPPEQVEIAKGVQRRLTQNLRETLTIQQLAREFSISATALKNCFKGVYGMPIAAYRKECRMKAAALLLEQEGMTVAEAARAVGYENQSKFAAAFKESMGQNPLEYRRKGKKESAADR